MRTAAEPAAVAKVFRNIPTDLNRRQALFIEGIRFSIETADLAYLRLRDTLIVLGTRETADPDSPSTASAMLDAWSIIDSLHRLRGLMRNMPGIEKRDRIPPIRAFFDSTTNVVKLRNTVQHLDNEIPKVLGDNDWAVLGSLSWGVIDPEKSQVTSCILLPGMSVGSRPLLNPLNRDIWHLPVDSISIERSGVSVALSDAMRRVEGLADTMERMLAETHANQIASLKRHGADVTIRLYIRINPKQIVPDGTLDPIPELPPEGNASDDSLHPIAQVTVGDRALSI